MKETTTLWNAYGGHLEKPCQSDVQSAEKDRILALYETQVVPMIEYLERKENIFSQEGESVLGQHVRNLTNIVLKEKLQVLGSETHDNGGGLIMIILQECLFPSACLLAGIGGSEKSSLLGATTPRLRKEAFGLIEALVSNSSSNLKELLDTLKQVHFSGQLDSEIYYPLKNGNVPVGLKNAGVTCYLNSLLQQLVMRPKLRNLIFSSKGNNKDDLEEENELLKELKYTFTCLLYGEEAIHFPLGVLNNLRLFNGQSAYENESQECVGETFLVLLEKLNSAMKERENEAATATFDDLFQCTQSTRMERPCGHNSEREEPTVMIPLVVRGKKGIRESLESIVEPEDLAMECETCSTKDEMGRKQTKFKTLPTLLAFSLIRSCYESGTEKICDRYEFEEELDMGPYMMAQEMETESSPKPSKRMKMEGVETFERAEDDVDGTVDAERSTSTLYQLVGVIVHQGATANSGHYITLVKDEDRNQWFNCNDHNVSGFDFEKMGIYCFGSNSKVKVPTASFLIYERKSSYHSPHSKRSHSAAFSPETPPMRTSGASPSHSVDPTTHRAILERNLKAISEAQKNDEEYIHFLGRVISGAMSGVLSRGSSDSSQEEFGEDSFSGEDLKEIRDFLICFMHSTFLLNCPLKWKKSTYEYLNNFLEWILNDEESLVSLMGYLCKAIKEVDDLRFTKFREFVITKVIKRGIDLLKHRGEEPGPEDSIGLFSLVQTLVTHLEFSEYGEDMEYGYSVFMKLLFGLLELYLTTFPYAMGTTLTEEVLSFLTKTGYWEEKLRDPLLKLIWKLVNINCEPSLNAEDTPSPKRQKMDHGTFQEESLHQPMTKIAPVLSNEHFLRFLVGSKLEEAAVMARHLSSINLNFTVGLLWSIRYFLETKLKQKDGVKASDMGHAISLLEMVLGVEDSLQKKRYELLVDEFFVPLLRSLTVQTTAAGRNARAKMMCTLSQHLMDLELFLEALSKQVDNFLKASAWISEVTNKRTAIGRLKKMIELLHDSVGITTTTVS